MRPHMFLPLFVTTDNMLSGGYKVLVIKFQLKLKLEFLISVEASVVKVDLVVTVSTLLLADLVLYRSAERDCPTYIISATGSIRVLPKPALLPHHHYPHHYHQQHQ